MLFWVLSAHYSLMIAAGISFALSLAVNLRSYLKGRPKILEIGSLIFLASLAVISLFIEPREIWKSFHMTGNAAMFLTAILSIALKKPFVLQYARDELPEEKWNSPRLFRTCLEITWAWAALFFFMTISSMMIIFWVHPVRWMIWASHTLAFTGAMAFTRWYRKRAES